MLFRAPAGRAALAAALDAATGARWSFAGAGIGWDGATLTDVRVMRHGDPLFAARRVALTYRLRDALPGGARRWGLIALDLDATGNPKLNEPSARNSTETRRCRCVSPATRTPYGGSRSFTCRPHGRRFRCS